MGPRHLPLETPSGAHPQPEPQPGPAGHEQGAGGGPRHLCHAGAAGRDRGDVHSDRLPQRHDGAGAQGGAGPGSRHPLEPPAAPVPGPRWPLLHPSLSLAYSLAPGTQSPLNLLIPKGSSPMRTPGVITHPLATQFLPIPDSHIRSQISRQTLSTGQP